MRVWVRFNEHWRGTRPGCATFTWVSVSLLESSSQESAQIRPRLTKEALLVYRKISMRCELRRLSIRSSEGVWPRAEAGTTAVGFENRIAKFNWTPSVTVDNLIHILTYMVKNGRRGKRSPRGWTPMTCSVSITATVVVQGANGECQVRLWPTMRSQAKEEQQTQQIFRLVLVSNPCAPRNRYPGKLKTKSYRYPTGACLKREARSIYKTPNSMNDVILSSWFHPQVLERS